MSALILVLFWFLVGKNYSFSLLLVGHETNFLV